MTSIKHTIISASNRPNSQSIIVSQHIADTLQQQSADQQTDIIDLAKLNIPLWINDNNKELWQQLSPRLNAADAFILVVPEWHGMAPPAIKNLFIHCALEFSHKPALIVGVSSGAGGCSPIHDLRLNTFKNSRICYIPEQVIIRNVNDVITQLNEKHPVQQRILFNLKILDVYARALKSTRNQFNQLQTSFPYGMS